MRLAQLFFMGVGMFRVAIAILISVAAQVAVAADGYNGIFLDYVAYGSTDSGVNFTASKVVRTEQASTKKRDYRGDWFLFPTINDRVAELVSSGQGKIAVELATQHGIDLTMVLRREIRSMSATEFPTQIDYYSTPTNPLILALNSGNIDTVKAVLGVFEARYPNKGERKAALEKVAPRDVILDGMETTQENTIKISPLGARDAGPDYNQYIKSRKDSVESAWSQAKVMGNFYLTYLNNLDAQPKPQGRFSRLKTKIFGDRSASSTTTESH